MQKQRRVEEPRAFLGLVFGALLLSACARTTVAPRSEASAQVPMAAQSVFVGPFNGEFGREMRAAVSAELEKSSRYSVVDTEAAADYVLTGSIFLNPQATTAPAPVPLWGNVQLLSRASGTNVWQYTYRDQRTGVELVVPTPRQQVRTIASQFVVELLSVTIASAARDTATF